MAYTKAISRDVVKTIGSENMRKGRIKATVRVFVKLCLFDTRGIGLDDIPTQVLAARARRACSTGPYVSVRVSKGPQLCRKSYAYPEGIFEE